MSDVIPFKDCIARPGQKLSTHLLQVKTNIASFLVDYPHDLRTLAGLAGLCHDLGKNHADWQYYINHPQVNKGPNHADCGAFFFSLFGYRWLQAITGWNTYKVDWLLLIRDIADHHSQLKNLGDNDGWLHNYEWDCFDLSGIGRFIYDQYRVLHHIDLSIASLRSWIREAPDLLYEAEDELDLGYHKWNPLGLMKQIQQRRQLTTGLIAGDRFSVKAIVDRTFSGKGLVAKVEAYCSSLPAVGRLAHVRRQAQQIIMNQLKQAVDARFYVIDMPTGYGKTLVSLKITGWLAEHKGYAKLIYIAPYLSILSQNSHVIRSATSIVPIEHHSLALIDSSNQRTDESQLAMESWAHPVISTSFQQLWKALFPKRAQDVLRRSFLKHSVLIIDEPQIFNPDVWNLFLCGLDALVEQLDLRILFLSATMPPFRYGLREEPAILHVGPSSDNNRYQLECSWKSQDEKSVAQDIAASSYDTQAAIFNTIEDAYRVYRQLNDEHAFLLHGLMIPIHKNMMIHKIAQALQNPACFPIRVISTQILEAGVNLSFQYIGRALSVLPSILQTAGRVNRHLEGEKIGLLRVFPFFRNGEKDTRSCIYERSLQNLTDQLLKKKEKWLENDLYDLIRIYYKRMFNENTREAALASIRDAYEGNWSALMKYQPFARDYQTLPIFIPWVANELGDLPADVVVLQKKFAVSNPLEIYEHFRDKSWLNKQSFVERKQFMILFHYYVLDLPLRKAFELASKEDFLEYKIPLLEDTTAYDTKCGLKTRFDDLDPFIL